METFCNTLGYLPLQRHLLAVPIHTLEDAVIAGNEYLQIKPASDRGGTNIRQVGKEKEAGEASFRDHPLGRLQRESQTKHAYAGSVERRDTSKETALTKRHLSLPIRRFRETERARNSRISYCLQ